MNHFDLNCLGGGDEWLSSEKGKFAGTLRIRTK
jgi:hypothetical protein